MCVCVIGFLNQSDCTSLKNLFETSKTLFTKVYDRKVKIIKFNINSS